MTVVEMHVGDLEPDLVIALTTRGRPLDTSQVETCEVIGSVDGSPIFTRAATITDDGVLTMLWSSGDTDDVYTIRFHVVLTWPGGKKQTIDTQDVVKVYSLV